MYIYFYVQFFKDYHIIRSNNLNITSFNTIKDGPTSENQIIENQSDEEDDEEKISYQEKYSGLVNPNIEILSSINKNKKNVIKKESKAVTKIIKGIL